MPTVDLVDNTDPVIEGVATAIFSAQQEATGIVPYSIAIADSEARISLDSIIPKYENITLAEIDRNYDTIEEWIGVNSPTFDEDSDGIDYRAPRMSTNLDTFDEVSFPWYDSDSA